MKIVERHHQGEVYEEILPEEGLFLLQFYDMDTSETKVQGTWEQIQNYLIRNETVLRYDVWVLSNSRGEVLHFDPWR